jgi:hypothetical protein
VAKAGEILVTTSAREAAEGLRGVRFTPVDARPPGAAGAFRVDYRLR